MRSKRSLKPSKVYRRSLRRILKKSRKKLIRTSLLAANLALLVGVVVFIAQNSASSGQAESKNSTASSSIAASNPLDQVSSADIAVNIARMTNLAEASAVTNYADSFNAQVTTNTTEEKVVTKPQVVTTLAKSRKDIQTYVTKDGDTVGGLATIFSVTSDSIKNTNSLTADKLDPNQTLIIPPINGIVYTVKAGDSVDSLAQKYSANKELIASVNDTELVGIKPGEKLIIPDAVMPIVRQASVYAVYSAPATTVSYPFGETALYGGSRNDNGYAFGWCTWYVANRRAEVGMPIPRNLGNASTWKSLAQRAGFPVDNVPSQYAVIWTPLSMAATSAGHVGFVDSVNADGSIEVSDMNVKGWNVVSRRSLTAEQAAVYYYIH